MGKNIMTKNAKLRWTPESNTSIATSFSLDKRRDVAIHPTIGIAAMPMFWHDCRDLLLLNIDLCAAATKWNFKLGERRREPSFSITTRNPPTLNSAGIRMATLFDWARFSSSLGALLFIFNPEMSSMNASKGALNGTRRWARRKFHQGLDGF